MAQQINPESGYVANANNKNHADDYPHYLGSFWEPESRILRIRSLLEIEDSLNAQFMQNMQLDVYSEHAREMVEILLRSEERRVGRECGCRGGTNKDER